MSTGNSVSNYLGIGPSLGPSLDTILRKLGQCAILSRAAEGPAPLSVNPGIPPPPPPLPGSPGRAELPSLGPIWTRDLFITGGVRTALCHEGVAERHNFFGLTDIIGILERKIGKNKEQISVLFEKARACSLASGGRL